MKMMKQFVNIREWYASITVCYTTILFGISLAFVADLKDDLQGIELTKRDLSIIGSLNLYASVFGTIIVLPLVDKLGRKKCIMITLALQTIAWILQAFFVFSMWIIYVSRLLVGLASGMRVVCVMYISETAGKERRGFLTCLIGLTISIGTSLTYIVEYVWSSRLVAILALGLSIAGFVQTYFLPETKYWYIMMNNDQKAQESSLWFDNKLTVVGIRNEIEEIRQIQNRAIGKENVWQMLKKRTTLKNIAFCILIMIPRAGSGRLPITTHPIGFYSHFTLPLDAHSMPLLQGTLDVLIVASYAFVADYIPRKVSAQISCWLMNFCLIIVFVNVNFFQSNYAVVSWLTLIVLMVYILVGTCMLYTCTTAIVAEIASSSTKERGVVQCLSYACFNLYSAVFTQFLPLIWATVPIDFILAYFFVNLCVLSFVVYRLPETSGKALHLCVSDDDPKTESTKF